LTSIIIIASEFNQCNVSLPENALVNHSAYFSLHWGGINAMHRGGDAPKNVL